MAKINSVKGLLDTKDLGFTLMHEHIIASAAGIPQAYPELLGKGYKERVVNELKKLKEAGVETIIDATTLDLGRHIPSLAEVSIQSGVNIIACTGFWLEISKYIGTFSIDQYADLFIREIRVGMEGTDIKAGILKAAGDNGGVTPIGEIIHRAVARAHLETDTPIMLHSFAGGQVGRQQLSILREEGVDLNRVKVDHLCDTSDLEYITWLADQGCYLGMDNNPGIYIYPNYGVSPEARVKTIKALIDAGYADRILLSHDASLVTTLFDTMPENIKEEIAERNPYGLLYINEFVFPQLSKMGVPDDIINRLCVDNPRNFFEGR